MRKIALGLALLLGACASSAAEGQTLCSSAVSAFDGKDLPAIQEFLRAAQNVFDELDAQSMEKGEPTLKTKLTDKSLAIAVSIQRRQLTKRQEKRTSNCSPCVTRSILL